MYKEIKTSTFIIVVIIIIVLLGGGVGAYYYFSNRGDADSKNSDGSSNKSSTTVVDEESDDTATSDDTSSDEVDENGWTIYKNYKYSYLISVPTGATITNESEEQGDIKNSNCVEIKTDNYSVRIAAPLDEADPTICLRTGFGTDWSEGPTDSLSIQSIDYNPTGMHTEAASAGYYQDYFHIDLVDGRRIEYTTSVNEKYGTMTKTEAKNAVHTLLQTYSPAE
jgi:hypothetical protein